MNLENSSKLLRELLCSIDLSFIDKEYTEAQQKEIASLIKSFYDSYFKNDLNKLIDEQKTLIALNAVSDEQLQFSRGTINGLVLIREWFEKNSENIE